MRNKKNSLAGIEFLKACLNVNMPTRSLTEPYNVDHKQSPSSLCPRVSQLFFRLSESIFVQETQISFSKESWDEIDFRKSLYFLLVLKDLL